MITIDYEKLIGGIATIVAIIITNKMSQSYGMAMYAGIHSAVHGLFLCFLMFITKTDYLTNKLKDILSLIQYNHIIYLIITIIIIYMIYKLMLYLKKKIQCEQKYLTMNIYTLYDINRILQYYKIFNFAERKEIIEYGEPNLMYGIGSKCGYSNDIASCNRSSNDVPVYFNDTKLNKRGYYMWETTEIKTLIGAKKKENKEYNIDIPYLCLSIENNDVTDDIEIYYDKMMEALNKINEEERTLYYAKVISLTDEEAKLKRKNRYSSARITSYETIECVFYKNKEKDIAVLENIYIDSFYHTKKNELWNMIKKIHFEPDIYKTIGQIPRTGLLLYGPPGTGKSSFGYRIATALGRHIISLDLISLNNKNSIFEIMRCPELEVDVFEPKDVVFIFDEFDRTIFTLAEREEKRKKINASFNSFDSVDIITKKHKKNKSKNNINLEENLTVDDLLELLQGAVPLDGAIIIATTNKYEEIKKICPALFRPGRLTPIHFGYIDNAFIEQMTLHVFKQPLYINIKPNTIIPVIIIEMATSLVDFNDLNGSFEKFKNKLIEYCYENDALII